MTIEKKTYKIRMYPFTYKYLKRLNKLLDCGFDTTIQTLLCIAQNDAVSGTYFKAIIKSTIVQRKLKDLFGYNKIKVRRE